MRPARLKATRALVIAAVALAAGSGLAVSGHAAHAGTIAPPPVNGQFDYQIGGAYSPKSSVSIIDRDRAEKPATGKYNICYVNSFQTQPGEKTFWVKSHSNLLLKNSDGSYLIDKDWPDEYLLDTSTAKKRTALVSIVGAWIDGCKAKGFQAIEPDNLDSWTRSQGKLSKSDAISYATLLAARAHKDGLAIAQKNTTELGSQGKSVIKFDFAIAEECQVNDECDAYTEVYGAKVIEIEYTDNGTQAYNKACSARGKNISIILRDRDVVPAGDSDYRYKSC